MRRLILAIPFLLGACGLDGTDTERDEQPAATAAAADPDFAPFEFADTADAQPRPEMQVQIVLDRLGFGPGVVDGTLGLSTVNALKGFQEANALTASGTLDDATRTALARWSSVPATRVIRIPASWGRVAYRPVPDEPADQAAQPALGYETLDEKLAERFHTTPEVLRQLNPGGRPAGSAAPAAASASPSTAPAAGPSGSAAPTPAVFRPGQLVRVPNIGLDAAPVAAGENAVWQRTLASLGVAPGQPKAARIVVDKSAGTLRAFDGDDKLVALFTVTTGSQHDPLPLGEWKVLGVARNPPFHYNPDLFWDAAADDEKAKLPPGPNGPVGVVWIDLSKEHYGIHGTPEPQTIGRAQSHGCVRLTNWDAARLAEMVDGSTEVEFVA
ncbi:MAG: hypothetical protein B7Z08_06475 [Sphingomonadales bacterium 32-68-7]|nr:MAG: hypothetical protein B7Z33_12325 [Sphingomonadales bacterium 12-68-11]OYX09171.1 MAG: hypothetical protein B7Z08_06475 [Sphingomonadales bacterium 32-68-7]